MERTERRLACAEYRLMCVIWNNEPISSPLLWKICEKELGWKRTTTYTVLKRLHEHGLAKNEKTVVTSLVAKATVCHEESRAMVNRIFDGSLPAFIASFLEGEKLTRREADILIRNINENTE